MRCEAQPAVSAPLSVRQMFIIWKLLVPVIRRFILIFQLFLCHIKNSKRKGNHFQFFPLKKPQKNSGHFLDADNSVPLKAYFNCPGCLLDNFISFWIMLQKVFVITSQKKLQTYGPEPLKKGAGWHDNSKPLCLMLTVYQRPKEKKQGINKHHIITHTVSAAVAQSLTWFMMLMSADYVQVCLVCL